ncbi:MAG: glutaredoxin family protein [Promethearchaeota archaeon]
MDLVKVEGQRKNHNVLMYTISTCGWCKMTKQFMKDHSVEHEYIDVDLCSKKDREKIHQDIRRRGGRLSFPTIIIDDKILITGFRKKEIEEVLGL